MKVWPICLKGLFVAPFAVALCLAALTVSHVQVTCSGVEERRALHPWPQMSIASSWTGSVFRDIDSYMSDHLSFRSCLIKARSRVMWMMFRKSADNHVIGDKGQIFYRFIAEQYLADGIRLFPFREVRGALDRLRKHPLSHGKQFLFMNFRNKEFLLRDKLPLVWRSHFIPEPELPFVRLLGEIRKEQWHTIDLSPMMEKLRLKGVLVYSPLQEHHPSPETYFFMLRRLLVTFATMSGKTISPPDDFPKEKRDSLVDDEPYLNHFYVRPLEQLRASWTRTIDGIGPDGHTKGITFVYEGTPNAPLPNLIVYGDSNSMLMFEYFGKLFLPFFKSVVVHWNTTDLEGWERADLVMINFTDQFWGVRMVVDSLVDSLEERRRRP